MSELNKERVTPTYIRSIADTQVTQHGWLMLLAEEIETLTKDKAELVEVLIDLARGQLQVPDYENYVVSRCVQMIAKHITQKEPS